MAAPSTTDLIANYDELMLVGEAPSPEEYCAAFPDHPRLLQRLRQLARLRGDLDRLFHTEGGPPEPTGLPHIPGFRLLQPLGRGGMGTVYLAEQEAPRRRCALKLLNQQLPSARERFRREADLAARLDHPGIAKVYAFGEAGEQAYLAAEMVYGFSLRSLLSAADRVSPQRPEDWLVDALRRVGEGEGSRSEEPSATAPVKVMVGLMVQVADALAHAHQRGVIHRDIKPSNIIVSYEGRAKLIDFGIAVPKEEGDDRVTRTGTFIGSHGYAAPEQLLGEHDRVGPWTDTYALGATLFEVLTQRTPFEAVTYADRLATATRPPLHGPRFYNPRVPRALDRLVMRALHPEPAVRFHDGEEMAEALRACPTGGSWGLDLSATRWLRLLPRHPAVWTTILTSALSVALASMWWEAREELTQVRAQYRAAEVMSGNAVLDFVIGSRGQKLAECVGKGSTAGQVMGRVSAELTVSAGVVRRVAIRSDTVHMGLLARDCLVRQLKGLELPGVGYAGAVTLELDLRVSEAL